VQQAEFDAFVDAYLEMHAENIGISGEEPDYFARYKIAELRRLWTSKRMPEPAAILDFGCGIGASLPHLAAAFPSARLTAFDVSERSLAVARSRFSGVSEFVHGSDLAGFEGASFDLVFTSCVFHHIDAAQHVELFRQMRALLRAGGKLAVFEHNPANPVTRYIVATCPFDKNAVLISPAQLRDRQRQAGLLSMETRYIGFFPHALAGLRWLEPHLSALPIGAQYYTLAYV
jgi:trans-aconitate methyltransferase